MMIKQARDDINVSDLATSRSKSTRQIETSFQREDDDKTKIFLGHDNLTSLNHSSIDSLFASRSSIHFYAICVCLV